MTIASVAALGGFALTTIATNHVSAATLGGLTAESLGAWVLPGGAGVPTMAAWDNFARADGTNLNGQATGDNGPAWQVVSGTWTTSANAGKLSVNARDAALVVDCGATNATVTATITLPANGNFSAGLALKQGTAGFLSVEYGHGNSGNIEIARTLSGSRQVLASVTNLGRNSPATLAATYLDGTVTVQLNGVSRLSATLDSATEAVYRPHTRFGLSADNDSLSTFDNFRCET